MLCQARFHSSGKELLINFARSFIRQNPMQKTQLAAGKESGGGGGYSEDYKLNEGL